MGQGAGAFVTVGSLSAAGPRTSRRARAPGTLSSDTPRPAGRRGKRRAGAPKAPPLDSFPLARLSFLSPSYTHRPWFTPPAAPRGSRVGGGIPRNDFVWEILEIGSRPPNPSPGSHRIWGLGRERSRARPTSGGACRRPALSPACPCRGPTYPIATYPIATYPIVTYPIVVLPYSRPRRRRRGPEGRAGSSCFPPPACSPTGR